MKSVYESKIAPNLGYICSWATQGMTDKDIAKKLGVSIGTLKKYKKCDGILSKAYAQAKEKPDDDVENALYKRACGYTWERVRKKQVVARDGSIVELLERENVDVPPDPTSATFWLSNRRKDKWSYHPEQRLADEQDEGGGVVELPAVEQITPPEGEPNDA